MPDLVRAKDDAGMERLFPGLGAEEQASLDAWFTRLAALILRMYDRISSDPDAYEQFLALTDSGERPSMTGKVDSPNHTN